MQSYPRQHWLPAGKQAAVCFTIDDIHPGRSADHYDGGGDMDAGALGLVRWLLDRHPELHVTLFTTADWREISPTPNPLLKRIPGLRDQMYLTRVLPRGSRALDQHREFTTYLQQLPRTEVALHGLHHIHKGPLVHVEFQNESPDQCRAMLEAALAIFERAGIRFARGMCPPGWNAPPALLQAMQDLEFHFVASARDIRTAISVDAKTSMSGLKGTSLIFPTDLGRGLVHLTANFQATSPIERARQIIDAGGVLSVKAHIIKAAFGHVALDGVDTIYCNYLDALFALLERDYGSSLWWTTPGMIADRCRQAVA